MTESRRCAFLIAGGLILALTLTSSASAAPEQDEAAIVFVQAGDPRALLAVKAALEALGARLPHRVPPSLLAGSVPPDVEATFVPPDGAVVRVLREGRDFGARVMPTWLPPETRAVRLFVTGVAARTALSNPAAPASHDIAEPVADLDLNLEVISPLAKAGSGADCGKPGALSAFLVGSVSIGIVMPESSAASPNTEDWDNPDPRPAHAGDDRRDLVVAEIMEGADRLVMQFPEAALSFAYQVHRDIVIDIEPIGRTVAERGSWITPAMEIIATAGFSPTASTATWLRTLRDEPGFDTDWAVAAYVADDLNDADNGFPPTGFPFAYALLGGPYMVMTYDNDGYSIDGMDSVFKHELGHTFHALDEYTSAGNSCTNIAGYLRVPNENNDSTPACLTDTSCIMRGGTPLPVCTFTVGQLGMRDSDSNGIPDVRQQPPNSTFDQASPLLLRTNATQLTGTMKAKSLLEESPSSPVTYTVNRVALGQWRLDGGPWMGLAAADGSYGERCEGFVIDLMGLSEGWHSAHMRATNDVDITEPSPAEILFYVNSDCVDDAAEEDGSFATAVSRQAGLHTGLYHCAFDEDWSRFHLSAGASVTLNLRFNAAEADLALTLLSPAGSVIASGTGAPGDLSLTHVTASAGSWRVRVDGAGEREGAYSLEVLADCVDDILEPNLTVADGPLLANTTRSDLTLCAADLDHYRIGMQAGESLSVTISFDDVAGDLDLELLDPTGASVSLSNGTGGTEVVMANPTDEGVYAIRVVGKTPGDTNAYTLDLVATGCLDDARENDDDALTATPLAVGESVSARLCSGDEDWYALTVTAGQLVRLIASFDAAAANLDLELRDATGTTVIASSTGVLAIEDITRERLRAGDYRLRVFAADGGSTDYSVSFQSVDPILLYVAKDPVDALLSWTEAQQECYVVRRSLSPADFTGAIEEIVQEGAEAVPDRSTRHVGAIVDGVTLWSYLVDPSNCGASLVGSSKTATPYPVVTQGIGTLPTILYTITLANDSTADVFGAVVVDDIPFEATNFSIVETPPGSTDASIPAPGGRWGRGVVNVVGITVPRGGTAVVKFAVTVGRFTVDLGGVISNQANYEHSSSPVAPPVVGVTDDPATTAFEDDTRVLIAFADQRAHFTCMWHQEVDIDMRVIDPCGNIISPQDLSMATCGMATMGITRSHSCAAPGTPTRFEAIEAVGFQPLMAGTWRVELAYPASAASDTACRGRLPEEVTVAWTSPWGAVEWRTTTLTPGSGFVPVLDVVWP